MKPVTAPLPERSRSHAARGDRRVVRRAIVSKDLNGIVQTWNRAAERMLGHTAEEMIGRSIRCIIPPDRQDEENDVLARIRRGEAIDHYETVRMRKDDSLVEVSPSVSPVRGPDGEIIGASKIAPDITQTEARATGVTAWSEGRGCGSTFVVTLPTPPRDEP